MVASYEPHLVFNMGTIPRIKRKHFKGICLIIPLNEILLIILLELEENDLKETLLIVHLKKFFIDNTS